MVRRGWSSHVEIFWKRSTSTKASVKRSQSSSCRRCSWNSATCASALPVSISLVYMNCECIDALKTEITRCAFSFKFHSRTGGKGFSTGQNMKPTLLFQRTSFSAWSVSSFASFFSRTQVELVLVKVSIHGALPQSGQMRIPSQHDHYYPPWWYPMYRSGSMINDIHEIID